MLALWARRSWARHTRRMDMIRNSGTARAMFGFDHPEEGHAGNCRRMLNGLAGTGADMVTTLQSFPLTVLLA